MDKLEKLKSLLSVVNDGLSKSEFLEAFKKVTAYVTEVQKQLIQKIDFNLEEKNKQLELLKQEFNRVIDEAKQESDNSFGSFRKRTMEAISSLFIRNDVNKKLNEQLDKVDEKIKEVNQKISSVKNGVDGINGINGKDADETKIVKEVLNKIELPEIDKSEIEQLRNEINELKRNKRFGGGTSAMGVAQAFKWILKTETPVGAINGVNTQYTVKDTIFAVLSFSLNGEVIAQLPNYTISKNKITFSSALPAAYAGKDFECKYI